MKQLFSLTRGALVLVLSFGVCLAGCGLLDVENPNNLVEDDLSNPAAAPAMANGLEASVTRAMSYMLAVYSTASDELTWVGSRDAYQQLDFGNTTNPFNEFTDLAFPYVGEARWLADNFVPSMEAFLDAGSLGDTNDLIRAYLYQGIIYTMIADMFDDFAFSDRREAAPPVGPDGMISLYDTAIQSINNGLNLGPSGDLEIQLLAMRARIKHARGVWEKVNPVGSIDTANPLVNATDAVADAQAALALMTDDWKYDLVTDGGIGLDSYVAGQVNDRLEMTFSDVYVQRTEAGTKVDSVAFIDTIDGVVHPYLKTFIPNWVADTIYPDMTVVSAREMYLIIAEGALASGGDFVTPINGLRAIDGLSPYAEGMMDPVELLAESRQANLFIQGRRLADMYRFGEVSPMWQSVSDAVQRPGSFFPITAIELRANPNLN